MGRRTRLDGTEIFRAVVTRSHPSSERPPSVSVFGPYARRGDAQASITRETSWKPAGAVYSSKIQRSTLAWEDVE